MIEALFLLILGVPILFVAILVWMCTIIAVLDAALTYSTGESKICHRIAKRLKK